MSLTHTIQNLSRSQLPLSELSPLLEGSNQWSQTERQSPPIKRLHPQTQGQSSLVKWDPPSKTHRPSRVVAEQTSETVKELKANGQVWKSNKQLSSSPSKVAKEILKPTSSNKFKSRNLKAQKKRTMILRQTKILSKRTTLCILRRLPVAWNECLERLTGNFQMR